jgi:hypothetical protein
VSYYLNKQFTGKEADEETGLIYFGARYLDPQTSMWLSADPAMGEYVPVAPIDDEAKKSNQNLPGMGGVFNYVNLHTYHYAGNNPVKYVDPDGKTDIDDVAKIIHADLNDIKDLDMANRQLSTLQGDGYKVIATDRDGNELHFRSFGTMTIFLDQVDPTDLPGSLFLTLEFDLVGGQGFEGSISFVIDFEDILNSGLNFSGGEARGVNVGVAIGIGVVRGSLEGRMPLGVDVNLPGGLSAAIMTDEQGLSGGSLSYGLGGGLSVSSQRSWTLSPRKIMNWVNSWRKK